jgi:inorganic pyrophosphatase
LLLVAINGGYSYKGVGITLISYNYFIQLAQEKNMDETFWMHLETLVNQKEIKIDRPARSPHPRYPKCIYPLDYGFLVDTRSGDGEGIDVWMGSRTPPKLNGIVCALDELKGDLEIKLIWGCSEEEIEQIIQFHRIGSQHAILISNPLLDKPGVFVL